MTIEKDMTSMAWFAEPWTVAIYGIVREGCCELVGSGTFVAHGNRVFILSAEHVLKARPKYQYYGHSIGRGRPPQRIAEINRFANAAADVILVEIIPESLDGTSKVPLAANRLMSTTPHITNAEKLFVHGFPGKYSEAIPVSELHSRTLPAVLSKEGPSPQVPGESIFLHYDFKESHDANGTLVTLPDPRGLSGSAVWNTFWNQDRQDWTVDLPMVIGVLKHWLEDSDLLEAVPIEEVQALIGESERPSPRQDGE